MIHDDLTRHFERTSRPPLSPEFSMNLRRELRAAGPPQKRRRALRSAVSRIYFAVAAVLLAQLWPPVTPTPVQIAVLAAASAAVILTLRRALRLGSLARVLREAVGL